MSETILKHIPVDQIRGGEIALRGVNQDEQSFRELLDSIRDQGVISAISVREKLDEATKESYYELIDGLQRWTASKIAGRPTIPAQILDKDDEEVMIAQIIANAKRVNTKPVDFANQIRKLMVAKPTMTMGQIADTLHSSPQWIDQILNLKNLHEQIKPLVNDGHIVLANAFALSKLQPPEEQLAYRNDAQTKPSSEFTGPVLERVKQLKAAAREGKSPEEAQYVPIPRLRKLNEMEKELQEGVPVSKEIITAYTASNAEHGIADVKSAQVGFALGVQYALKLDPKSQEAGRAEFEAKKKASEEEKVRRNAERAQKRQQEADERAQKAREEAEKASKAAAALPQ